MIDQYLPLYIKRDSTLVALLNTNNGPVGSIYRERAFQNSNPPFIVVVPSHDTDPGNTSAGTLIRKAARFCLLVCGNETVDELDPIAERVRILIEGSRDRTTVKPLRQMWLPSEDAEDRIWVQYVNIANVRYHSAKDLGGGERSVPCYEFELTSAFDIK